MSELERIAAAVLAQWRNEGGGDNEPIAVTALLDRVLPYRVARRVLGIEMSEDYEALMLRLLAEEEGLLAVSPPDAAGLARTAVASKLPDLSVLQLLRSASVTLNPGAIERMDDAPKAPTMKPPRKPAKEPEPAPAAMAPPPPVAVPVVAAQALPARGSQCWSCHEALPLGRDAKFCPFCGADQRPPTCAACGSVAERNWKHCADCGARL